MSQPVQTDLTVVAPEVVPSGAEAGTAPAVAEPGAAEPATVSPVVPPLPPAGPILTEPVAAVPPTVAPVVPPPIPDPGGGTTGNAGGNDGLERALQFLAGEVAGLRDLFSRRLYDDKARNAGYEALQEQSRALSKLLTQREYEDLFKELLAPIDALGGDGLTLEVARGAGEELLELLRRRGVTPIPASGTFDPARHQAVGTVPEDPAHPSGTVVRVVRPGYALSGQVLRFAQVVVAAPAPPAAPAG